MDLNDANNIQAISSLFDDAPALIAMMTGPEHIFQYANKLYLDAVGQSRDIIGLPIRKALPELAGQNLFERLDAVYKNAEVFKMDEIRALIDLHNNGTPEEMYFNLVYMPVKTGDKVSGIFVHAVDITAAVHAKKAAEKNKEELEYAQEKLRSAIEVANLGTWERNLVTGALKMNQKLEEWRGLRPGDDSMEAAMNGSPDKEKVLAHMRAAMEPGSDGVIDLEYDVVNNTGEVKRLHSQGRVFFSDENKPLLMTGITHDVTMQRLNEAQLQNKVASKTTQLAEANDDLRRLNESLEQFVYIASHDLQEPLRKINVFTEMLLKSSADINAEGKIYLDKIEKAAKRMSLLISNLLEFSQVSSKEKEFLPTDLNKILGDIRLDYELLIRQKNAAIQIDCLPVIEAVPLQMYQLFYNLVGNALKFAKAGAPCAISISCTIPGKEEIRKLKLNESFSYCKIAVKDNGIGFDNQYAAKIFEIFQRLHGKQEYAGTGIGLALAQKIADNHGGSITAISEEGSGAVFNVILPVTRS